MVYPEVQTKAQEQIDRVIGSGRLPTFDDRASLPYIDCIVWECLRWNPGAYSHTLAYVSVLQGLVTPLGLGRKVTEDNEYRGYKIPKNTTVLPNVW